MLRWEIKRTAKMRSLSVPCALCCRWWLWYKTYLFQWSPWWTALPQQRVASLLPVVTSPSSRRSPPSPLRAWTWGCSARRRRWPSAERCRGRWEPEMLLRQQQRYSAVTNVLFTRLQWRCCSQELPSRPMMLCCTVWSVKWCRRSVWRRRR